MGLVTSIQAQQKVSGLVTSKFNKPLQKVQLLSISGKLITTTKSTGYYEFLSTKESQLVTFYLDGYELREQKIVTNDLETHNVVLDAFSEQLSEVEINANKREAFEMQRLKDVEGTAIYAGKKTEVVLVEQSLANLASNNARQIYSQVAGLNIFQNDDAGLQLNIGGRGLDPNRTSNFNTRQNGYDISADVLGYPESYYTPAAEGIEQIQIVRGAASLQYGTQFGGLINFVLKKPNPNTPFEIINRNTLGSNGLFTNFISVNGTSDKFSYLSYYNYKQGNGFRPNSEFNSKNAYGFLGYEFNDNTKLEGEITYLNYLAKQSGGLTDKMFIENMFQSNRARNWFKINWLLYSLKLSHEFSNEGKFTFNFFGLNATRDALGFRENRVDQPDLGGVRDLIKGEYNNFGFEARYLKDYKLLGKRSTVLVGSKFYKANNTSLQGPGTDASDANFNLADEQFPTYKQQSNYKNPNTNVAVFGENIFYITDKLSLTPGLRFEYIKTGSDGYLKKINLNGAGDVILEEIDESVENKERSFVLLGLGGSYKPTNKIEFYVNISQNYRSVTFSDLNIVNPSFEIGPLSDEKGYTADLGARGNFKNLLSYDVSAFSLFYNNRIGFVPKVLSDSRVKQERTNIGDARIVGLEGLLDFNLKKIMSLNNSYSLNYFINVSAINSQYTKSDKSGILGNNVEFVPDINFKTGLRFGYNNLLGSIQYTYLSQQYTDGTNSDEPDAFSGIVGLIPSYDILDVSLSYKYKYFKLEAGVNNVLNNYYFTRRATGYPGPGIIPSAPRNWYTTLQIKID